jgi:hypothetical protein
MFKTHVCSKQEKAGACQYSDQCQFVHAQSTRPKSIAWSSDDAVSSIVGALEWWGTCMVGVC